ncbi:MAG: pyridoxal-phosphate dependent enzyme [Bacteroidetes bacterium]|nr:MAG: pyridoxal-phosphate dependent enzyme [Bacteroidota bacterium]
MEKSQLLDCYTKIRPYIHRTPVMTSRLLNEMAGADLYFKCENLQRMGAFKMRGAIHAVLNLSPEQQSRGVVTHSSGNFAQALALAAKTVGIPAYIVMPENAPAVKKRAVHGYGGQITECTPTLQARESTATRIREETGATFLHPYDDYDVILGQGTAALELLEEHPGLDYVIAPVGGGGLVSGTALAAHFFGENCRTLGAEPFAVDDAYRSLLSGKIESNASTDTIADGLKTNLGEKTFPLIRQHVQRIIRVEETEIVEAMRLIWERMKLVTEPSGAVPFAAVLRDKDALKGAKIGVILSGGNVDLSQLPF